MLWKISLRSKFSQFALVVLCSFMFCLFSSSGSVFADSYGSFDLDTEYLITDYTDQSGFINFYSSSSRDFPSGSFTVVFSSPIKFIAILNSCAVYGVDNSYNCGQYVIFNPNIFNIMNTKYSFYNFSPTSDYSNYYFTGTLRFNSSGQDYSGVTFKIIKDEINCPECETCPEPEPCPIIPDNPYDEKLDNINKSIIYVSASLFVICFFVCIYKIYLRIRR